MEKAKQRVCEYASSLCGNIRIKLGLLSDED